MSTKTYIEEFDAGPGGWLGWIAGGGGPRALEMRDSAAVVRSPWTIDFNHAPPGAGYLHLLYVLLTMPDESPVHARFEAYGGVSRFVQGKYPRDFTGARFSVRTRGELAGKGAQLMLAIQADVGPVRTNYVLSGQPIRVAPEWQEQTLTLTPEPGQWTCLGTRGPGADCDNYGEAPIADALRDVNIDLVLVLFPVTMAPATPLAEAGDVHRRRAGKDYPVAQSFLPSGYVMLDRVRIDFA